jgi:hypothetical protein
MIANNHSCRRDSATVSAFDLPLAYLFVLPYFASGITTQTVNLANQ